MRIKLAIITGFCFWAALPSAHGQNLDEREFFIQHGLNKYFDLPLSAQSLGMGHASVPTSQDVWSVFENPAGLAETTSFSVSPQYTFNEFGGNNFTYPSFPTVLPSIREEIHSGALALSLPVFDPRYGVLGLGITGQFSDVNDPYQTSTDHLGLTLAYGIAVTPSLNLGYSLSYFYDSEDHVFVDYDMDDGLRNTFGAQWEPVESWIIGFQGYYGFGDVDSRIISLGLQDGDRDVYGFNAGVSKLFPTDTTVAVAFRYDNYDLDAHVISPTLFQDISESGDAWSVHAGVEQLLLERLRLRAGYYYKEIDYTFLDTRAAMLLPDTIDFHALTMGVGYSFTDRLSVNAAFEYRSVGNEDFLAAVNVVYNF